MVSKMIENNRNKCCYCGGCAGVCPVSCITLNDIIIEIDNTKCINCLSCVRICPVGAMTQKK